MKRLLVGMMVAGMLQLGLAPGAGAAEIPPTVECQGTFKSLYREVLKTVANKKLTNRQAQELFRKFLSELQAAGCITDATAVFRKDADTPKSPECVAGAKTAAEMWKVDGQRINVLYRKDWQWTRAQLKKATRIEKRMLAVERKGGHEKQVKRLKRKVKSIFNGFTARGKVTQRKAARIIGDQAASNILTFLELASLGCLDLDYSSGDKPAGPADRLVKKRMNLIGASWIRIAQTIGSGDKAPKVRVLSTLPLAVRK